MKPENPWPRWKPKETPQHLVPEASTRPPTRQVLANGLTALTQNALLAISGYPNCFLSLETSGE